MGQTQKTLKRDREEMLRSESPDQRRKREEAERVSRQSFFQAKTDASGSSVPTPRSIDEGQCRACSWGACMWPLNRRITGHECQ